MHAYVGTSNSAAGALSVEAARYASIRESQTVQGVRRWQHMLAQATAQQVQGGSCMLCGGSSGASWG